MLLLFLCFFCVHFCYFVYLGLGIGIAFYNVPCRPIYFVLFLCVLCNINFICFTRIVSGQSALMHFWATVCKTVRPILSDRCLSCLSVCLSVCPVWDVRALWPNVWTDQDETWQAGRPRTWPHCVRWKPSSTSPKGAQPPIFGPYPLRPNGRMDQDAT